MRIDILQSSAGKVISDFIMMVLLVWTVLSFFHNNISNGRVLTWGIQYNDCVSKAVLMSLVYCIGRICFTIHFQWSRIIFYVIIGLIALRELLFCMMQFLHGNGTITGSMGNTGLLGGFISVCLCFLARAVEAAGADSVSLINTLLGMRIDIRTRRPILRNNKGGMSGAAVFPIAVRMVNEVYNAVKIPVIGLGGICTWQDAIEMTLAGASAIQVGTAMFTDPYAPIKIIEGMDSYLAENNIANISELVGQVQLW